MTIDRTIAEDEPVKLSTAAKLAFPDGSMKASSLRRQADRGRLEIFEISGRYYTTLGNVKEMIKLCRVAPKAHVSGSDLHAEMQRDSLRTPKVISSSMQAARSALEARRLKLQNQHSPTTSQKSAAKIRARDR